VYGAQSYRPFGTAAQFTTVPAEQARELPDGVTDEIGACLGFWPMVFANLTIRLLGSDDFPQAAKRQAAEDPLALRDEQQEGLPQTHPLERSAAFDSSGLGWRGRIARMSARHAARRGSMKRHIASERAT
jgi:hypothetical protein